MKMIINTEKDLRSLIGKFVLQVNSNEPDKTLMDYDWGFVKEKRLYLVGQLCLIDLYGYITKFKDFEEFKAIFNDYAYSEDSKETRFHRLLTNKEIDYLATKLKEENY